MADSRGILGEIAAAKRVELAQRLNAVSLDGLRDQAQPTHRSLSQALARPGARFILEIKKASPSAGMIRRDADVTALASGYSGVADALSVLTDDRFFGGSLEDLSQARAAFEGPLLAKDFFIDPRQVVEARIAGADAVLVILSLLDDAGARQIIEEASRFAMDVLVEVHNVVEMHRALALGAPLIGINNRNLRDLSVDLSTTERLAAMAPDRLLVSESGVRGRTDVDRLSPHVDAFLVGTSLMESPKPAEAARELVFGRVKLCGLSQPADFRVARAAAHVGLIFVPGSLRSVSPGEALRLASLHPSSVGVFRNASIENVSQVATMLGLAAVQLHGGEDAFYVRALARCLPRRCEIWKAIEVGRTKPDRFDAADRLLFDNGSGGTGQTFDWRLVRGHADLSRAIVAGGIGPDNAVEARRLGAYAIDVGSKVEDVPGRKSPKKIRALFDALRSPSREQARACA